MYDVIFKQDSKKFRKLIIILLKNIEILLMYHNHHYWNIKKKNLYLIILPVFCVVDFTNNLITRPRQECSWIEKSVIHLWKTAKISLLCCTHRRCAVVRREILRQHSGGADGPLLLLLINTIICFYWRQAY